MLLEGATEYMCRWVVRELEAGIVFAWCDRCRKVTPDDPTCSRGQRGRRGQCPGSAAARHSQR
jgi:hypothetical protein